MAGKHGFSGVRPPDRGDRAEPSARKERLVRMAPPANDNRFQGIDIGRLRFTGVRVLFAIGLAAAAMLVALGTGLI